MIRPPDGPVTSCNPHEGGRAENGVKALVVGHDSVMTATERERVLVRGVPIDPLTEGQVVSHVREELRAGRGGWIVTPNVDHLRHAVQDSRLARLIRSAQLSVADGAPVVWAAKIAGRPVPARVTGADLLWS